MAGMTSAEHRDRRLEEEKNTLKAELDSLKHKLGQVSEDNGRDAKPLQNLGAVRYFNAQASVAFTAGSGNTMGSGRVYLLQVITESGNPNRYQLDPPQDVPAVQGTGGTIGINTWCGVILSGGIYTVIWADCVTVGAEVAPDPPGEGG